MKRIIILVAISVTVFASCTGPEHLGCVGQTCDKHGHTTIVGYTPYKK